jgi:predicted transcriptional regulator of viral defense system
MKFSTLGSLVCRLSYILVESLPPTFTTRTAIAAGLSYRALYQLRDDGELVELSRGVFRSAEAPAATFPDLLAVAYRTPIGVICAVSAAAAHNLTDELPPRAQVAVPRGHHRPRIAYPPAQVLSFDVATFELGLGQLEAAPGEQIRIYSPTRTVVDLMRLRRQIGENTALTVLNRYLRTSAAEPAILLEYARALGVLGPVRAAVDVASAG